MTLVLKNQWEGLVQPKETVAVFDSSIQFLRCQHVISIIRDLDATHLEESVPRCNRAPSPFFKGYGMPKTWGYVSSVSKTLSTPAGDKKSIILGSKPDQNYIPWSSMIRDTHEVSMHQTFLTCSSMKFQSCSPSLGVAAGRFFPTRAQGIRY